MRDKIRPPTDQLDVNDATKSCVARRQTDPQPTLYVVADFRQGGRKEAAADVAKRELGPAGWARSGRIRGTVCGDARVQTWDRCCQWNCVVAHWVDGGRNPRWR